MSHLIACVCPVLRRLTAVALTAGFLVSANAALVTSMRIKDPTGTIQATDSVEVWATLSVASTSEALNYDANATNLGLPASFLPTRVWDSATRAMVGVASIAGSLGSSTSGAPDASTYAAYRYFVPSSPGSWHSFARDGLFSLSPGESLDVLVGTLTPLGIATPPGTLSFNLLELGVPIDVVDVNGRRHVTPGIGAAEHRLGLFECRTCVLTRTIASSPNPPAVPEPGTLPLTLLAGLGMAGWLSATRGRRSAAGI